MKPFTWKVWAMGCVFVVQSLIYINVQLPNPKLSGNASYVYGYGICLHLLISFETEYIKYC